MTEVSAARTWREQVPKPIRSVAWRAWVRLKPAEPGLLMRYAPSKPPKEQESPPGYEIRVWRPGDECRWVALLNASGSFGEWDLRRLKRENRGLVSEAQVFASHDGRLVAATGVLERPLRGKSALEMAWVTRDPSHTGKGLGRAVFVRSLRKISELRQRMPVYLYTDDHRLTAIAMYLELGFVPELRSHKSYPSRWERVFVDLARRASRERS